MLLFWRLASLLWLSQQLFFLLHLLPLFIVFQSLPLVVSISLQVVSLAFLDVKKKLLLLSLAEQSQVELEVFSLSFHILEPLDEANHCLDLLGL